MDTLLVALKDFGFPAIAFGLMWWMCNSTVKENTKAIRGLIEHLQRNVKQ